MRRTDTPRSVSRRKYIAALAGSSVAAFAGCSGLGGDDGDGNGGNGGNGDGDGDEWTLEIQHWWTDGAAREAIDFLFEGYRERNEEAEIVDNPVAGSAGQELQSVIREKVLSSDPPSTWQDWPGRNLSDYVEADALKDIGDIFEGDYEENFREGPLLAARAGNEDNPYVCVPTNIHRINQLFYDTAAVEEAGVDPGSIGDPNELLEIFEQIDADTDMTPLAVQTSASWSTLQLFGINLAGLSGAGAYEDFRTGEGSEDDVREAVQVTADMLEYNLEDAASLENDEAAARLIQGEAVFAQEGDWQGGNYQAADDYDYDEHWSHVAYPGTEDIYQINTDGFPYPQPNPSPAATDAWMEWVGTAEAQEGFNPIKGGVPCRTDVDVSDFPPFLQVQFEHFSNAEHNTLTIAHGDGVTPAQDTELKDAFARFLDNRDVDETTQALLSAVEQ